MAGAPLLFWAVIHLISQHGGLGLLLLIFSVFYFMVLEDGTDESLSKLKCFEPAGHGKLFHIVPCIAVKPQETSLHQEV